LIERVFSRYKLNALVLQVEQLRWDADPTIAPSWAGSKRDVRDEIAFARARGLTVYPLVQGMGHMEWLFANKRNLAFAEDPQTPYALNVTDPKALAHLGRIMAEADDLFGAPAFHVGLDEVTMRGRFPFRSAPRSFADLFTTGATHWRDFFAQRSNKPIWMWADMLLHKSDAAPSFGTAPTPEDAARLRRELPKNIVLVDWQYGAHERFPSLKLLKDAGFPVLAATWFNPANIQNFSREAASVGALGAIQTTWAGYESSASVLDTEHRKQFSAMILAADYFWNGGDGPAPKDLFYNADEVFTQAMNGSNHRTTRRHGRSRRLADQPCPLHEPPRRRLAGLRRRNGSERPAARGRARRAIAGRRPLSGRIARRPRRRAAAGRQTQPAGRAATDRRHRSTWRHSRP
jgi:hypothetical protein